MPIKSTNTPYIPRATLPNHLSCRCMPIPPYTCRYSPRWDAKRTVRELVAHACEEAKYLVEEELDGT